ncbi:Na+/Pi-cotransporter [Labrenzia sp. THAF191b]|uniref:Na/Pi cotransporter family protein n=1 Tax=unclassified Labrenzia TaxID=2648686 RepID=UPI001267D17B|nr:MULTISPECIES: Na/Pi symporter [unclassified Labrenzia]QFT00346.1 Na+/Pi-cotransporter [Labrenzia sp. THAF191b]QFT06659.1 Na+/Pi-cotransporter [Labrenzia sp. THAF191a]QFT18203.1 Na+/Pi-cotransporter [Labrenzia sp. THAF187b]
MFLSFMSALGGVGLFLIGMLLLTDGLKALAAQRMRDVLSRFTSTPLSGAVTGALTTAVIQSSSATTVAAVGFVASGLLTFPQALGVIFGANVGTTLTGWLVAVLGFKLDLGQIALPFVFFGAIARLAFRGRIALAGQALAGFCLIFIGIEHMKDGLDAFSGVVTPTDFPPDTLFGRLQLVLIGMLITIVTQSSSAGIATALAALGAGAINFPQAAALVIGMDVGTTFTAALATIGGGTMARRTGYAHVIYNVMTGFMAFFLLGPFQLVAGVLTGNGDSQIALVAFHSFFNALGVVLVLPLARPFARLIEHLVPEKGSDLTSRLDPLVLRDPHAAASLAGQTVTHLETLIIERLRNRLGAKSSAYEELDREDLAKAIAETRTYLDKIIVPPNDRAFQEELKGLFHILDHLSRLLYRCDQQQRIDELSLDHRLKRLAGLLLGATDISTSQKDAKTQEKTLDRLRLLMRRQRRLNRDRLIAMAAADAVPAETVWLKLDALRWLHRVSYHLWRIRLHQNVLLDANRDLASTVEEARIDVDQD